MNPVVSIRQMCFLDHMDFNSQVTKIAICCSANHGHVIISTYHSYLISILTVGATSCFYYMCMS